MATTRDRRQTLQQTRIPLSAQQTTGTSAESASALPSLSCWSVPLHSSLLCLITCHLTLFDLLAYSAVNQRYRQILMIDTGPTGRDLASSSSSSSSAQYWQHIGRVMLTHVHHYNLRVTFPIQSPLYEDQPSAAHSHLLPLITCIIHTMDHDTAAATVAYMAPKIPYLLAQTRKSSHHQHTAEADEQQDEKEAASAAEAEEAQRKKHIMARCSKIYTAVNTRYLDLTHVLHHSVLLNFYQTVINEARRRRSAATASASFAPLRPVIPSLQALLLN